MMRHKILLVDDMATIVKLERALLGDKYDYVEAHNGQEAIARACAERPDLILMDVIMPVMGGIEALRQLKALPETRAIPVVMLTTLSEPDLIAECRDLGCDAFLSKPIDAHRLQGTVLNLLKPPAR
jgi:CheY-like chemotaxis protein